jgi:hypothetical protein
MTIGEFGSSDSIVRNARLRILDILENESRDKEGNGAHLKANSVLRQKVKGKQNGLDNS